jgi:hypothetical protein
MGKVVTKHKGTVLQGTFGYRLPYHVAWDATSTSKSELSLKLGIIEIEVFAWEDSGIPTWCKDEQGTPLRANDIDISCAGLTSIYLRRGNERNAPYLHLECQSVFTCKSAQDPNRASRNEILPS